MIELNDKLYTSTEVANILGVSLRSVYRYLDEGKIQADIKTATGRHRFSKQNIMEFLQPSLGRTSVSTTEVLSEPVTEKAPKAKKAAPIKDINLLEEEAMEEEELEEATTESVEEAPAEEPVDWLARFRAAAEKYKAEQATKATEEVQNISQAAPAPTPEPVTTPVAEVASIEEEPVVEEKSEYFYLSAVGSLKDIAQQLDKAAKKASVDYVFTMDAGMSLFKPIRPFSLIHAYVRPEDRAYFEKALKLTEVNKSSAQLCLLMSDENSLYHDKKEMYGLNVVSKERLRKDLTNAGEKDLIDELDAVA